MSPSTRELLLHILDETTYLLSACDQLSRADFLSDPTLKRAFARSLEIIGEAVKSLPADLTDAQSTSGLAVDRPNARSTDPSLFWDRLRNGLGCGDVQGGRA